MLQFQVSMEYQRKVTACLLRGKAEHLSGAGPFSKITAILKMFHDWCSTAGTGPCISTARGLAFCRSMGSSSMLSSG